jgi:hypothetical protein
VELLNCIFFFCSFPTLFFFLQLAASAASFRVFQLLLFSFTSFFLPDEINHDREAERVGSTAPARRLDSDGEDAMIAAATMRARRGSSAVRRGTGLGFEQ